MVLLAITFEPETLANQRFKRLGFEILPACSWGLGPDNLSQKA